MPERRRVARLACLVGVGTLIVVLSFAGFAMRARIDFHNAMARAQELLSQGSPADARRALDEVLRSDTDNADALILVGKCLVAEEAFDEAAEVFSRVPVDSPWHEEASLSEAFAYLHNLRFDAGEEALVRHLERYPVGPEHPNSQAAHEELKWVYFNQFRRRELEELLQASLARNPENHALRVDLLNIEFRRQLAQEGVGHLKTVNEKQPGQPGILLALGYCCWKLGDVETAWKHIRAAMDLRPEHLETRFVAAEILMMQNELDSVEALLALDDDASPSLRERFEKDDRWWWLRSKLVVLRADEERALEYVDKALDLRPSELQYVFHRGVRLQVLGRSEEAAETLTGAKELEACESRLNEIVRSGALEMPTVEVCLEVAELCEKRGRRMEADHWRCEARQIQGQTKHLGGVGVVER